MASLSLTVTQLSRGLSDFLNQVQYQGQTLDIQRGKKVVARVLPAVVTDGFPISQLDASLANGLRLSASERQSVFDDGQQARRRAGRNVAPLLSTFTPSSPFSIAPCRRGAPTRACGPHSPKT